MTLDEARRHIGEKVAYRPYSDLDRDETGVITRVNDRYAFVRYGTDEHSKATDPARLGLAAINATP